MYGNNILKNAVFFSIHADSCDSSKCMIISPMFPDVITQRKHATLNNRGPAFLISKLFQHELTAYSQPAQDLCAVCNWDTDSIYLYQVLSLVLILLHNPAQTQTHQGLKRLWSTPVEYLPRKC